MPIGRIASITPKATGTVGMIENLQGGATAQVAFSNADLVEAELTRELRNRRVRYVVENGRAKNVRLVDEG